MLGTEMVEGAPDECFVPRSGQCLSTRLNFNEEGGGVGNGGQMRRSQELRAGRGTHEGTIPTRKCIQLCQSTGKTGCVKLTHLFPLKCWTSCQTVATK